LAADFAVPPLVHLARIDPVTRLACDEPSAVVEVFVARTATDASGAPLPSTFSEDDEGD